jgi:hypothetical protein
MFSLVTKKLSKIVGKKAAPWVLAGLALAIVALAYTYTEKSVMPANTDGFENEMGAAPGAEEEKEGFAPLAPKAVSGMSGGMTKAVVDPAELMPKDVNSEWARLNPHGSSDLAAVTSLDAGHHIGINTVATSLRNPNLQLRSEVPNPRTYTGPWNQSTIEGDPYRRELEIGSGN